MSLQGSIETFAISDVLRLLAATAKSGRLHVQGPSRSGTLWVDSSRLLAADSPSTPHVEGPVDVLFQLLRFERGSFRFEVDKYPPEPGEPLDIELALGEAEGMLAEWRDLETRIPSGSTWVRLRPELRDGHVTLGADEWRTVVAVGDGRSVADIGDALDTGELATHRSVDRLLQLRLIEVGEAPSPALPAPAESDGRSRDDAGRSAAAGAAVVAAAATEVEPAAPPPPPPLVTPPPVEATSWSPPESALPAAWAANDFSGFAPPPAASPPTFSFDAPRADAGLSGTEAPAEQQGDAASSEYGFENIRYEYPAAPGAEPAAPSSEPDSGQAETTVRAEEGGDAGYPPLPPPLPPVYDQPGASVPPPPPPPPAWGAENGQIPAPAASAGHDAGWAGSLASAIEQADAPAGAPENRPRNLTEPPGGEPPRLAPPAPPPAPPTWGSPSALFEGGASPERLAPPPPPPPSASAGAPRPEGETDPQAATTLTVADSATTPPAVAPEAAPSDDFADIERQLFNLSPKAREAVKQSSGLFDGRNRR